MLPKRKEFKYTKDSPIFRNHENDRDMKWESQNGKITPLHMMDTNHIKNAINKYSVSDGYLDSSVLDALRLELLYREINKNQKDGKKSVTSI